MKSFLNFKLFLVIGFCLSMASGASAQEVIANGTAYEPVKAEEYLDRWDSRIRLEYFSIDSATNDNIQTVFQISGAKVDHIRIAKGQIDDVEYLFTAGISVEGVVVGDYYVSALKTGLGPCPQNCD
jgi:hypothetical protein